MKMADWTPCEAPSDEVRDQLVWLYESPDGSSIYVHRSGQFALSEGPIGGGWEYSIARIDRRDPAYDRRQKDWPQGREARVSERRDSEQDWAQFIKAYGNGEADDSS